MKLFTTKPHAGFYGWVDQRRRSGKSGKGYIEDNTFINQTSGNPAYFYGGSAVQSSTTAPAPFSDITN